MELDKDYRLHELQSQAEVNSVARDEKLSRIADLQDFITSQPTEITKFDEKLVKWLIGKITVSDERFSVEFKSGVSFKIKG